MYGAKRPDWRTIENLGVVFVEGKRNDEQKISVYLTCSSSSREQMFVSD